MRLFKGLLIFALILASAWLLLNFKTSVEYLKNFRPQKESQEQKTETSVFENKSRESSQTFVDIAPEVKKQFEGDPKGEMYFKLGWGVINLNPYISWDYKTTPALATINSIEFDEVTGIADVELTFLLPNDIPFVGIQRKTKILCDAKDSYLVANDKTYSGVDKILSGAATGDSFIGFCMDEECSEIKGFCKLYKK